MNKSMTVEEVKRVLRDIKEEEEFDIKSEKDEGGTEYIPLDFDEV